MATKGKLNKYYHELLAKIVDRQSNRDNDDDYYDDVTLKVNYKDKEHIIIYPEHISCGDFVFEQHGACCGVGEIGYFFGEINDIKPVWKRDLVYADILRMCFKEYRYITYAGTMQDNATELLVLQKLGFKYIVPPYTNKNTGRMIHFLGCME